MTPGDAASGPSAASLERRLAARAEVARVCAARADQLAGMLRAGLSPAELEAVEAFAAELSHALGDAWRRFVESTPDVQLAALSGEGFDTLPWHSLLQSNPYARLQRWKPIALRAYA